MRNIKLVLEYDGTNFVGWQTQASGRSVQEEISRALEQILQEKPNLIGAGRTDSGVHARGQVANVRTNSGIPLKSILNALNGLLPEDICIHSAEDVPEEFHARFDAHNRMYRYFIALQPLSIGRQYAWYLKFDVDIGTMNTVAGQVCGEHDFRSFCKAESSLPHFRCIVTHSFWSTTATGTVYEIRANRFLHGMVRTLVGTMVDIGRGYTPVSGFMEILNSRDRRQAGMAAPAHGLFLEEVTY